MAPDNEPLIAVTPPMFSNSPALKEELLALFPGAILNPLDRYLEGDELVEFLSRAHGAIIGRDRINAEILKRLPQLKIIAKYGVGMDSIDLDALKNSSVEFRMTPGVNKNSVAELALCFIIGLLHNVFSVGFDLKKGQWNKDGGFELQGKAVGVIGCGNIGERLIELLKPFSCKVMVHDIVPKKMFCNKMGAVETGLNALIEESDIISLHVPLTEMTKGMIDSNFLSKMKSTAILINTSRGAVVCYSALKKALTGNGIAGAAADVFDPEPPDDLELLSLPNFMGTPHIGGNTEEAVLAMGRAPIGNLIDYFGK